MPELLRCKGRILLAASPGERDAARACFEEALSVAKGQEAKALELRAALDLAGIQAATDPHRARALVEPLYGWFVEGHATPDLVDARRLLESLR